MGKAVVGQALLPANISSNLPQHQNGVGQALPPAKIPKTSNLPLPQIGVGQALPPAKIPSNLPQHQSGRTAVRYGTRGVRHNSTARLVHDKR
jgi:hypothetical protein